MIFNSIYKRYASIISPVFVALIWEISVDTGILRADYFPPPSALIKNFKILIFSGELWLHTSISLYRLILAFAIAAFPGIIIGLIMGSSKTIRLCLEPFVSTLYAIPKIALLPLIMLILGIGERSFIVTASITAFFQIIVSTMAGVMSIETVLLEAAINYGAKGKKLFLKVILPGTLPYIFTGLRLGLGLALILVIAVEIASAQTGLGSMIWTSWQVFKIENMYCTFIIIGLIGVIITHGLEKLRDILMPWREIAVRLNP